jgi:membrane protease YdiL (CAAX protease family)
LKALKSICKNEAKIKEISVLDSFFILAVFLLIVSFVNFLSSIFLNIPFNMSIYMKYSIVLIITMIMQLVIGEIVGKHYIECYNCSFIFKATTRDFFHVFYFIIGFILIRQAYIIDFLVQFNTPVTTNINYNIQGYNLYEVLTLLLLLIFQILVFAPIFEEIFFRGIVLNGLLNKYKRIPFLGIFFSSAIFGIAHLNLQQGINAFLLAIIIGFIYYCTKSLKLTMFAHFLNNFFIFILAPDNTIIKAIFIIMGIFLIIKSTIYFIKIKFSLDNM